MAKIADVQEVSRSKLRPYERNSKIHSPDQVERIAESIRVFGFLSPCLIDRDYNIIAGHGRVLAAEKLGMETVPCVFIEGLSDAQRRAYIIADNRLTELAAWDDGILQSELAELTDLDFDVSVTGFDVDLDWFEDRERFDTSRQEGNEEYNSFLEKFEQKKTTDDCYTPDIVYAAVADYVAETYGKSKSQFVRPFYPGGDYEKENYPKDCVVVDNPPFSILSKIISFYAEKGIQFFLFAPTLTLFNANAATHTTCLPCGATVTYENGATVATSFLTNLEDEDVRIKTCPELYKAVEAANRKVMEGLKKQVPKYSYPDYVVTSAMVARWSKYGVHFELTRNDSVMIDALDQQKEEGKGIYGNGYLLSERAAAERAAAKKAAEEQGEGVYVWELSAREMEIVRGMG